jgi:hypothetical protein
MNPVRGICLLIGAPLLVVHTGKVTLVTFSNSFHENDACRFNGAHTFIQCPYCLSAALILSMDIFSVSSGGLDRAIE